MIFLEFEKNAYPDVDFLTVTPDNVEDFLLV